MATFYISGKSMYAKVFEHNRDMKGFEGAYEAHDGMYTVMLGVDPKSPEYKLIMSWNNSYKPKSTADKLKDKEGAVDGLVYFTFKRKHKFVIQRGDKKGEVIDQFGGAPKVIMPDGKGGFVSFPPDKLIGNGSDITVKLDVYTKSRVPSVRLDAICVDKLVEPDPGFNAAREWADEGESDISVEDDSDIPF